MAEADYNYYNDFGCNYYSEFVFRNPEFDTCGFLDFVVDHNRGDRDSGEVRDIAKHEVLRLAYEYEEHRWRFPNCFPREKRTSK